MESNFLIEVLNSFIVGDKVYIKWVGGNENIYIIHHKIDNINVDKSEILQIPPYEDRGVKFKGKYKIEKGNYNYELKLQQKFFLNQQLSGAASTTNYTYALRRKFYLTGLRYSYRYINVSTVNFAIIQLTSDTIPTSTTSSGYLLGFSLSTDSGFIDYSSSPIEITTRESFPYIQFAITSAMPAAGDAIDVQWIGFFEDQ